MPGDILKLEEMILKYVFFGAALSLHVHLKKSNIGKKLNQQDIYFKCQTP
jgi:hypothetical protein